MRSNAKLVSLFELSVQFNFTCVDEMAEAVKFDGAVGNIVMLIPLLGPHEVATVTSPDPTFGTLQMICVSDHELIAAAAPLLILTADVPRVEPNPLPFIVRISPGDTTPGATELIVGEQDTFTM